MSRKIVALNVFLVFLLIWLGMQFRTRWQESKAREAAALARAAKPAPLVVPPPVPTVNPSLPVEFIDVAQRPLFSKDRDPLPILDPPPPVAAPPPEKPVPPLPSYYGQMAIGEPVILLSTERIRQKRYKVGDTVGDFKLTAFDRDTVTLEWNEKVLVNKLKDLTPKEPERPIQAAAAAPAAAANQSKSITKMGGAPTKPTDPILGPMNGLFPTCLPEDTSPDGTIKDGYRKKITPGMMGPTCMWEPISR